MKQYPPGDVGVESQEENQILRNNNSTPEDVLCFNFQNFCVRQVSVDINDWCWAARVSNGEYARCSRPEDCEVVTTADYDCNYMVGQGR